jgi:hypothetical protein
MLKVPISTRFASIPEMINDPLPIPEHLETYNAMHLQSHIQDILIRREVIQDIRALLNIQNFGHKLYQIYRILERECAKIRIMGFFCLTRVDWTSLSSNKSCRTTLCSYYGLVNKPGFFHVLYLSLDN